MAADCVKISWPELKSRLFAPDPMVVIDVRNVDEYRSGHIEGSRLIPLDELAYRVDQIDRDRDVVVVCRSGNRSAQACELLRERGFARIRSLDGGLSSWTA